MASRKSVYLTYLKSDHWRALREKRLVLAGRKCELCGAKKILHGHHVHYRSDLRKCVVTDIQILCKKCHKAVHKAKRAARKLNRRIRRHVLDIELDAALDRNS